MTYLHINEVYRYMREWHRDQKRLNGEPYFHHPTRVAMKAIQVAAGMSANAIYILSEATADALQQIALLHDVLEDCPITADDLANLNISPVVVACCEKLNKKNYKTYSEYIIALTESEEYTNELSIVKYADLCDNLYDLDLVSPEKTNKKDKYLLAKKLLATSLGLDE